MGIVYFIGAGPGDKGLITLKGAEKLKICDVVIYDRLVNEELLKLLKPGCKKIYAGKQAGCHYIKQEEINKILTEHALKDNIVARLKGGDSFVFGRGTEEIEALNKYNIPYEVIPGVTSAIAVPECAGIPVTHRSISRSFHVITGHTDTNTGSPVCNYKALVGTGGTLIFMMGLANIKEITDNLLKEGMPAETPAAVISGGTTEIQEILRSCLGNIAKDVTEKDMSPPAIIVIGETAAYNYIYNKNIVKDSIPYSKLCKKKAGIVATKALMEKLKAGLQMENTECIPVCGMDVFNVITQEFTEELGRIEKYNWIAFTSRNGVLIFFETLKKMHIDIRRLAGVKFAVIGSGTKEALAGFGINADFIPAVYTSAIFAKELAAVMLPGETLFLPRAVKGSRELTAILEQENISFKEVKIYYVKGHLLPGAERLKELDCIIFLSASGVQEFARLLKDKGAELPAGIGFICIGDITKKAVEEEYGTEANIITAQLNNAEGIINAFDRFCCGGNTSFQEYIK
ncbi:MAG: uroporphyrinogen-III C-methyltransferase [Lachnospiraceae bacterium]|nr:uroporphyrinogen-III C-methyltransferase [Lachnospiraceae bacterium]